MITIIVQDSDGSWSTEKYIFEDSTRRYAQYITEKYRTQAIVIDEDTSKIIAVYRHGLDVEQ